MDEQRDEKHFNWFNNPDLSAEPELFSLSAPIGPATCSEAAEAPPPHLNRTNWVYKTRRPLPFKQFYYSRRFKTVKVTTASGKRSRVLQVWKRVEKF